LTGLLQASIVSSLFFHCKDIDEVEIDDEMGNKDQ